MGEVEMQPDPQLGNANDDDDDDDASVPGKQIRSKKKEKKRHNKWLSVRRCARIPLKLILAIVTVYVCILSSERYFYYWVQTTIERTDVHVSEINFPAVTIIPVVVTNLNTSEQAQRLTRVFNMARAVLWQTPDAARLDKHSFDAFPEYAHLNPTMLDIDTVFDSMQYSCKNFFAECTWRRKHINCCSIFRSKSTYRGFAYVFNSLRCEFPDETWPWSVGTSGSLSGLNVKINRNQHMFDINMLGVIVHEPTQVLGHSIVYSTEDRIVIPVEPLRFTAEADVKARPLHMRRCLFESEIGRLGQSRSECISKCHVQYVLARCNCTLILPTPLTAKLENITDPTDYKGQTICGVKHLPCFNENKLSLFSMSNIIEESRENIFTTIDCGCFPQCDHTQYHTSTYTERLSSAENIDSVVEIDVYFQEETLFLYCSRLSFTLLDLMVSFGGIAGLIMGISVLGWVNAILDRFTCCRQPNDG
ncbi:blast:Pickpocket protein 19 [Drosophila guanche]|uniref:Blast:Pickpocket protein 19 n=1 Tax=Drosophila guanche TaxID=7266 RepID=A0A3B0K4H0_DROGU|nr:blast:Pickpocket protein 19 [Drosophila guanche]